VCFFVLCNRHWFNKAPGPDPRGTEMEVTYLPFAFSSDAITHDWSIFDYKCNFAFNARDISARGAEKRAGGAGNSQSLGIGKRAGSKGTRRCA